MGYSLGWIAFKGKSHESIREELHLRGSGSYEECPESDFTAAEVGEWYVIIGNVDAGAILAKRNFAPLSDHCDLVFCLVEEHAMFSIAEAWQNGKRVWSLGHNSESGTEHLDEEGDFPQEYTAIRDHLFDEQKNSPDHDIVDFIFDIPVDLAEAVTGFCHDKDIEGQEEPFEILIYEPPPPAKKSWFKRLFSR